MKDKLLSTGNYCMVAQFIFWSINYIYSWVLWNSKRSH